MLTIIPILLLFFAGFFILLSGRLRLPTGQTWLVASITGFVAWILMIMIRVVQPQGLVITTQLSQTGFPGLTVFQFSPQNWIVGFLLINLMLAVLFFEAQHLDVEDDSYLQTLAGSLIITAVGLLAIAAKTDRAFALAWAFFDLLELSILVLVVRKPGRHKRAISGLFARVLGIFSLFVLMALKGSAQGHAAFENLKNPIATLILITAILRSGMIIHPPALLPDLHFRRGVGSLLRAVPVATALVFVINALPLPMPDGVSKFLLILLGLCALFGALRWLTSRDEVNGRPHWNFAFFSLILISAVLNLPDAIIALGALFLTTGPLLILSSSRVGKVRWLILFSTAAYCLIPFSPSSPLRTLFASGEMLLPIGIGFLAYLLLVIGVIRFTFRPGQDETNPEKWMSFFHILGMTLLALMSWLVGVLELKAISSVDSWWISVVFSFLLLSSGFLFLWGNQPGKGVAALILTSSLIRDVWSTISQGAWQGGVNGLLQWIWRFIAGFFALTQRVLEGDGGIFWSLLFLAILASLLISRQVP